MPLNVEIKDYSKKEFVKPKYFVWSPGKQIIRILDIDLIPVSCYWFGANIRAIGWDDPQSQQNKRIKLENPDNYRNVRGYKSPSDRYFVNVLDRTPVKMCPNCEMEVKAVNGTFPAICPHCNEGIVSKITAKPLNKVRVLQTGKTLVDQFKTIDAKILKEDGTRVGAENFDIILHVVGTGNQRVSVAEETENFEELEVPPEDLYDTSKMAILVSEAELEQLMRGVSLRDLFAARRGSETVEKPLKESNINAEEIQKKVDELFA